MPPGPRHRRPGRRDRPYGDWAARWEVETTGCVLVRPDRHVAWRSPGYTPDSAKQLPAVIKQALGQRARLQGVRVPQPTFLRGLGATHDRAAPG
ncbi:MAG: hypothetical protein ABSB59_28480 [Streptosporangiaceae bacterium]